MGIHIETVHNPRVEATTLGELAEDIDFPCHEFETGDRALTLDYDELVVITGDLEAFARNVWRAVFDENPSAGLPGAGRGH